jgi:TolA-binding protein
MSTLDDLLSQRRRSPLSDADERRVQIGVKASREHQLALLAGDVFERAGAPQPGDAELVRKIVRQVEGEWSGTFQRLDAGRRDAGPLDASQSQRRPGPRWSRWAAVPTLIAGVAAASWGGMRALESLREAAVVPTVVAPKVVAAPAPTAPMASAPEEVAVQQPEPPPSRALPSRALPSRAVASRASTPAPARRAATRGTGATHVAASSSAPVLLRSAAPPASPSALAPEAVPSAVPPVLAPDETARGLFLRANKLRRNDWTAAADLYELLLQRFAGSTEAGVAEMALGKHALDEGHSSEALSWFRAYQQRPSGELTSEALWGEARALESLGETAAARVVWRRLVTDYPASAYAAVARQQLGS